jgi:CheY-like chemotaxis protein
MSGQVDLPPRILVVEDEPKECEALVLLLERLPARVEFAQTGNDAVDRLLATDAGKDPYRLIILDMWVPRASGHAVDEELGMKIFIDLQYDYDLIPYEVPIIVFTGHPSYDHCVKCIGAGAVGYIPKVDLETGNENVQKLFELCRKHLSPPSERLHSWLPRWVHANLRELVASYGGKVVGVVSEEAVKQAGLSGIPVDGCVLLPGESAGDVRLHILKDPILRWHRIPIIAIPVSEESLYV